MEILRNLVSGEATASENAEESSGETDIPVGADMMAAAERSASQRTRQTRLAQSSQSRGHDPQAEDLGWAPELDDPKFRGKRAARWRRRMPSRSYRAPHLPPILDTPISTVCDPCHSLLDDNHCGQCWTVGIQQRLTSRTASGRGQRWKLTAPRSTQARY